MRKEYYAMGMSASQARLLSITSRLTNNEFRAQTITNSKLRLATESEEASQKYMDALDSKKLVFLGYDDTGASTKVDLTPAVLYGYASMKNQYSLINAAGKILVSPQDAANFENTDTLEGFLRCYNLVEESAQEKADFEEKKAKQLAENEDYEAMYSAYETAHTAWKDEKTSWQIKYDAFAADWKIYQQELQAWEASNRGNLADRFSSYMGTADAPKQYCYVRALTGEMECYQHLLRAIIDYDTYNSSSSTYQTTTGQSVSVSGSMGAIGGQNLATRSMLKEVSDALNDVPAKLCDGDDDLSTPEKDNLLKAKADKGETITEADRLASDYKYNASTGEYDVKTLKEKAIDLYYLINKGLYTGMDTRALLINFTEGDLANISDRPKYEGSPDPGPFTKTEPKFTIELPDDLKEPEYSLIINDKEKGQWYTNLWYKMNGGSTAEVVQNVDNGSQGKVEFKIAGFTEITKNPAKANYDIIDPNLFTSSTWLQFALEHGVITLEKAMYNNPADNETRATNMTREGFVWTAMPYSNATDFIEVEDEVKIAKAEVIYKKEVTEIEYQDNKFDQDLKKLDTEHNALQTEYESIREAINKNTERSFKAFS